MRKSMLAFVGLWLLLVGLARGAQERRPNFIFILTDDQRWDIMGCVQQEQGEKARFPWFKTPGMDRLAREGVRFRNAFVVNSLCAPSRATFLTGQYGFLNGIVNNHTQFPESNVTHATVLKKAGYVTGYFGKWHQDGQKERPGFDVIASFIGQGVYNDCPLNINGEIVKTQGWVDDVTTDHLIKFIQANKDKPFDAVIGYKSPHGPRVPPERAAKRFAGEVARPVPNLDTPPIYRKVQAPANDAAAARGTEAVLAGAAKKANPAKGGGKRANAGQQGTENFLNYFRNVSAVDDNIVRILAVLDELKLADNTVVVFAGDNGYYLGEHQLGDKRSAYEESLRIPLLVRYPKAVPAGKTIDEMVLNTDLAPTLIDYAGANVPQTMQGRSWRPLLEGTPASDWRKSFFYCYYFEKGFQGTPMTTAVRTTTHKLIKYPGHPDWTELFDLQADPFEMKNLARDAAAKDLLARMEAEYESQSKAIGFKVPETVDKP